MRTLRLFSKKFESVPASTSWYLTDLGEARGKQELYTRQSPQRLKTLREHALIESAVSSNRIEGVEVDKSRIATIIFGKPLLRDRDEEEVRGYRQALTRGHTSITPFPSSRPHIGSSSSDLVNSRVPKEKRRALCFMPWTGLLAPSALPSFRMNARMSVWT